MKVVKCLILVATLASVSCKSGQKSVDVVPKVKCQSAQLMSENVETSHFVGRVEAAEDLNLGFRVAGIIASMPKADGAVVRKGDVVAMLDDRDYKLQLDATQAEYDAVKAEVDRVVELYKDESVSANDYDKATNGLRAITAKLTAHRNALADCLLRAPIDGYVVKSNFSVGEAVAAGTPVVTLISGGAPQIVIDIPAKSYLRRGDFQSATAKFELYNDKEFALKLKSISPKANLNQLYRATFSVVPSLEGELPAVGVSAMVEMNYSPSDDICLELPTSALFESEGKSAVWVVEDNHVKSHKVEIQELKSDGKCYITSGIDSGAVVVTAGVGSLKEGQEVAILEEPTASNVGGVK